ncbi:hypothetical protein [Desulfofalx alkaliphila]|uniref:hypothetical protein n=1 Tax=Desulfofalx alkaliphila TaxID=105483 RepID=UPI0012FE817C|nr:hypothetical protein [Desulfofalx alkaliphila]
MKFLVYLWLFIFVFMILMIPYKLLRYKNAICPHCQKTVMVKKGSKDHTCPLCKGQFTEK